VIFLHHFSLKISQRSQSDLTNWQRTFSIKKAPLSAKVRVRPSPFKIQMGVFGPQTQVYAYTLSFSKKVFAFLPFVLPHFFLLFAWLELPPSCLFYIAHEPGTCLAVFAYLIIDPSPRCGVDIHRLFFSIDFQTFHSTISLDPTVCPLLPFFVGPQRFYCRS